MNISTIGKFTWLHFSDLHVGMSGQSDIWPRFQTVLADDFDRLADRIGKIDLVVFSGDLAQRGVATEFKRFDEIINRTLDALSKRMPTPPIVALPGNHDLQRPDKLSPQARALKQFWSDSELRSAMFDSEGAEYREFLNKLFKDFMEWQECAIAQKIHLPPRREDFFQVMPLII
jgi:3',5'-cyclic AMP phosphodiesterase CpdA